jgi:hypothetical protein
VIQWQRDSGDRGCDSGEGGMQWYRGGRQRLQRDSRTVVATVVTVG